MSSSSSVAPIAPSRAGGPTDPSHDDLLRRGVIVTEVSRATAWAVTASFLLMIVAVPIVQAIGEKVRDEDSSALALFSHAPTVEHLRQFEKDLEDASYPKDYTQQRLQMLLTAWGRVGNKNAVVGRHGWLYYKPGITFLSGPAFLDPDTIQSRERGALDAGDPAIHADPVPAIAAFAEMLRARGIRLVLFPVPDKAMLEPHQLHGRVAAERPSPVARPSSWGLFVERVGALGVTLFDPTPGVLAPSEPDRFLEQDTHWNPAWMQTVARSLAKVVNDLVPPPTAGAVRWRTQPVQVSRVGDIVDMLKLPSWQAVFLPTAISVEQVLDEQGEAWEANRDSDVLLLGDSFTNVFSAEPMGWGSAAGLAPHLSLYLGRGVDVIAQNDSGAFATRQALARELSAGEDRLAGKRVVIWEFASRELGVGDFKPIDWAAVAASAAQGEPNRDK
jgi:hypothetical protein